MGDHGLGGQSLPPARNGQCAGLDAPCRRIPRQAGPSPLGALPALMPLLVGATDMYALSSDARPSSTPMLFRFFWGGSLKHPCPRSWVRLKILVGTSQQAAGTVAAAS